VATSTIEVDRGIPLPARPGGAGAVPKYPWRTMDVGDSFLVPAKTPRTFSAQMTNAAKSTGRKFAARTVDGGCRVWRTA
jgi:hypothetical protein